MGLQLPVRFKSLPSFKASGLKEPSFLHECSHPYLLCQGPEDVFNLEHKGFPLYWEVNTGDVKLTGIEKTGGWLDVSVPEFGVTMAMKDMAYMYPKELSYDAATQSLTAWIWPDDCLDLARSWRAGIGPARFRMARRHAGRERDPRDHVCFSWPRRRPV